MNEFLITSHGWSASNWLAHALNLHPQIVCTHSARNVLADDPDVQSDENLKKNLHVLHKGYLNRATKSIDDVYADIKSLGKADFYGSVHVFRLRDLENQVENLGFTPDKPLAVLNLIRNPIDLVWSGYGQFQTLFELDVNELYWTLNKVFRIAQDFTIELGQKHNLKMGAFENLGFVGACAVLEGLKKDFDALEYIQRSPYFDFKGHVFMEKVTSDRAELARCVDLASSHQLTCSEAYLDTVYQSGTINKHRSDSFQMNMELRYESFADWQKEAFHFFMEKFDLTQAYEQIGYDLSTMSA